MLTCWYEQPEKRPTFTELKATFDSMITAENKDEYVKFHTSNDPNNYSPCYQAPLEEEKRACTLSLLSPKIERHQLVQFGGKQLLGILSKSDTNVSLPRHGSKHGMCVSKSAECVSFHPTCHDVEMDETEQAKSANARKHQVPESMHLTDDRNKREREINCYVDEPSKMIGATPIPTLSPAVSPVIVLTTPSEDNQFTET